MSAAKIRIAIVGESLAGTMAAAVLSKALPDAYEIMLVAAPEEEDEIAGFGRIEATLPSTVPFLNTHGIDELELLQSSGGCFSLGLAFQNWSGRDHAYFSPYGDIGAALHGVPFHQLVNRLRKAGGVARLTDFSLAALLAQSGRFAHPSLDQRSPLSTYSYALHLDCLAAAGALAELAQRSGAVRMPACFERVELGEAGEIATLVLRGGERLHADFFIDASGARRLLIGSMANARFDSWSDWLHCDRIAQLVCSADAPPAPYGLNAAHECGWQRSLPARDSVGETLFFASDRLDDEGAHQILLQRAHGKPSGRMRFRPYRPGRLERPWLHNCVAIGEAAAELEPLQSTSVHLAQSAIERLVRLIPIGFPAETEAREFNRLAAAELDRTRDFAILRYKINGRSGEPFWDASRAMEVPEELHYKIQQYVTRGRVPLLDGDLFEVPEWSVVFDGHGIHPQSHDMLAEAVPLEQLSAQLARMRNLLAAAAANVPRHGDYLEQLPKAAA